MPNTIPDGRAVAPASSSKKSTESADSAQQDAKPEQILELFYRVGKIANGKITRINNVTSQVKILAINAQIESGRAGEAGRSFGVVANHVKAVSEEIHQIANELSVDLAGSIEELKLLGERMLQKIRGQRLADLSLNMIDIIDRNLYERSCDVRWWATDSAVLEALTSTASKAEIAQKASDRLAVILGSYTVYLDIWIADAHGNIVANGRPREYPTVVGSNVSQTNWFRAAMATNSGEEYAVADIETCRELKNKQVAIYSAAVRENGQVHGKPIGALGIFFDWGPQAAAVVKGVRISEDERNDTRCLLIDSRHRIIAASDGVGILDEHFPLGKEPGQESGFYRSRDGKTIVGFSLTPGYETYRGLGWYGVIEQKLPKSAN
jgi:hypothetical protein